MVGTRGRLAAVKDQLNLNRALAHILADRPDYRENLRGILVGDGSERDALEEAVAALDLQDVIWLAGDRQDIPELLASMDVFVLPSFGEGISNSILEAMAAGLPVVATRVGGNPELVADGETGFLVNVGGAKGLADATTKLLTSTEMCHRMGAAARQKVLKCSEWNNTVNAYIGVYDSILEWFLKCSHENIDFSCLLSRI